jgi:CcmD family protein
VNNVHYLLVSVVLIWVLLIGYLVFLQLKMNRLFQIVEELQEQDADD